MPRFLRICSCIMLFSAMAAAMPWKKLKANISTFAAVKCWLKNMAVEVFPGTSDGRREGKERERVLVRSRIQDGSPFAKGSLYHEVNAESLPSFGLYSRPGFLETREGRHGKARSLLMGIVHASADKMRKDSLSTNIQTDGANANGVEMNSHQLAPKRQTQKSQSADERKPLILSSSMKPSESPTTSSASSSAADYSEAVLLSSLGTSSRPPLSSTTAIPLPYQKSVAAIESSSAVSAIAISAFTKTSSSAIDASSPTSTSPDQKSAAAVDSSSAVSATPTSAFTKTSKSTIDASSPKSISSDQKSAAAVDSSSAVSATPISAFTKMSKFAIDASSPTSTTAVDSLLTMYATTLDSSTMKSHIPASRSSTPSRTYRAAITSSQAKSSSIDKITHVERQEDLQDVPFAVAKAAEHKAAGKALDGLEKVTGLRGATATEPAKVSKFESILVYIWAAFSITLLVVAAVKFLKRKKRERHANRAIEDMRMCVNRTQKLKRPIKNEMAKVHARIKRPLVARFNLESRPVI